MVSTVFTVGKQAVKEAVALLDQLPEPPQEPSRMRPGRALTTDVRLKKARATAWTLEDIVDFFEMLAGR